MPEILCPSCGAVLTQADKQWFCRNGHSFDVARQGYVNLLPVTQKHSLHPGDTREQVAAQTGLSGRRILRPLGEGRLPGPPWSMPLLPGPSWTWAAARDITAHRLPTSFPRRRCTAWIFPRTRYAWPPGDTNPASGCAPQQPSALSRAQLRSSDQYVLPHRAQGVSSRFDARRNIFAGSGRRGPSAVLETNHLPAAVTSGKNVRFRPARLHPGGVQNHRLLLYGTRRANSESSGHDAPCLANHPPGRRTPRRSGTPHRPGLCGDSGLPRRLTPGPGARHRFAVRFSPPGCNRAGRSTQPSASRAGAPLCTGSAIRRLLPVHTPAVPAHSPGGGIPPRKWVCPPDHTGRYIQTD